MLIERIDRARFSRVFMTFNQEMVQVYSYNPEPAQGETRTKYMYRVSTYHLQ